MTGFLFPAKLPSIRLVEMKFLAIISSMLLGFPLTSFASGRSYSGEFSFDCQKFSYRYEYYLSEKKHPPFGKVHSEDRVMTTNADFIAELMGPGGWVDSSNNPIKTATQVPLLDPWGNPYSLLIDYDRDGILSEPSTLGNLTFKDRSFLMWSSGPDGKYGTPETNADNLYDYPGHLNTYQSLRKKKQNASLLLLIQLILAGVTALYFWSSKIRTYPFLSILYGDVFESHLKRHRRRARYIIMLIGLEIALGFYCLKFTTIEPVVLSVFILLLGCCHLAVLHIPRLKALNPETSNSLARLTLIPALLWSARFSTLFYALKLLL